MNQLAAMKITFDDELQAFLLLSSLPESWETLLVIVSNSAPDGVVTMSQVTSSLLNEETRRKSSGSSHSEALVMENWGRGRSKSRLCTTVINLEIVQARFQRKMLSAIIVTRKGT